jgi:hypothetical protein
MRQGSFLFVWILCVFTGTAFGQAYTDSDNSAINITNPNTGTVWNIPDRVALEWSTVKIDTSKSIRFFLVRNEMVVQELGSFKNKGFEDGIALAKNIGSGDRYQVVAIELFPDDKFKIAKRVTPFFSIVNKASDERKKKQQLANTSTAKNRKITNEIIQVGPKKSQVTPSETKPLNRETFEGRKISYTKELKFDSEDITIKIWDHGRQDGDIVSIYLNGISVVSKYYLTYQKKEFNVKLNPNRSNDLFLYAHNLGDSPPNTVSIEITDGKKSENIILNSDLQSCEAVLISVR